MNKRNLFIGAKVKLTESGYADFPELIAAEFMISDDNGDGTWEITVTEDLMDEDSVGDVYDVDSEDIELIDPNQTQDLQSIEMNFKSREAQNVDPLAKRDHKQLLILGILG